LDAINYFNSMAEKWDDTMYHDINKIENIIKMIGIEKGKTILDVGTGTEF